MKAPMMAPPTAIQIFSGRAASCPGAMLAMSRRARIDRRSTDMPGRRRPANGSCGSIVIFTGIRWTILVKLAVALSGGRSANSSPLAGAMPLTTPCTGRPIQQLDSLYSLIASVSTALNRLPLGEADHVTGEGRKPWQRMC
jgi:hypothetical protein